MGRKQATAKHTLKPSDWNTTTDSEALMNFLREALWRGDWQRKPSPRRATTFLAAIKRKFALLAVALVRRLAPTAPLSSDDLLSMQKRLALIEWNNDSDYPHLQVETPGAPKHENVIWGLPDEIDDLLDFPPASWDELQWVSDADGPEAAGNIEYDLRQTNQAAEVCALAWEIFNNPFKPAKLEVGVKSKLAEVAYPLALEMYRSRDFSLMPQLGKVLQNLGCKQDTVLAHCGAPHPHYKGCWAVDLVLGVSQP
jgi:hypothetical protein